jgi:hypothetical protein
MIEKTKDNIETKKETPSLRKKEIKDRTIIDLEKKERKSL